jgi:tripartite-type tricarboxylate transporter receptor subunit TctC
MKAGTPPEVAARLNEAVNKALKTDKVRETLAKLGTDPGGGAQEEFGTLVRNETARWTKVIADAGIKISQ